MTEIVVNDKGHCYVVYSEEDLRKMNVDPAGMKKVTYKDMGINPKKMKTIKLPFS